MAYKGDGKPDQFYPYGTRAGGHTVPANDEYRHSDKVNTGVNFPVLGIIDKVYFSDLSTNHSNSQNNVYSSNVTNKNIDKGGFFKTSEFVTNEKGYRLEVDVKIVRGPKGVTNSGVIERNVPLCISFGGIKNYGFVVPTPTSNVSIPQYTGTENGDWCLVQYIGGDSSGGVVTHIWPNQLNTLDAPIADEEIFAYARVAGSQITINKGGNFTLDTRNASEEITTDPKTGVISKKRSNDKQGEINIISRDDIVVAAGFPRTNETESSLPGGRVALKASKLLSLRSTLDEVAVNTQADAIGGAAMQVKIQGERGSLRPAARIYDKVKLTDGDPGDLFSSIGNLYDLLESVSTVLESYSQDPGAIAAGSLISAWVACYPKPTFQEGEIITGSKYCQIAGQGTAADIGGDESGIVNADGEQVSSEELVQEEIAALAKAIPTAVANTLSPNPMAVVKAAIPGSMQVLAKAMESSFFLAPYAPFVKEAAKIIPKIMEMISTVGGTSNFSTTVSDNLPSSASSYNNLGEIMGVYDDDPENPAGGPGTEPTGKLITPGLMQQTERADLTQKYMQTLADVQDGTIEPAYTQKQIEDMFGVPNSVDGDNLPTGPQVGINPATETYWKVSPTAVNDVITGPPGPSVGYTYRMGVNTDARNLSKEFGSVLEGFTSSWFGGLGVLPTNQQTYVDATTSAATASADLAALAANPSIGAVLSAVAPLTAVVGDGLIQRSKKIVDEELSS